MAAAITASWPSTPESPRLYRSPPVSTTTPTKPTNSPAALTGVSCSSTRKAAANSAVNSGMLEFRTDAVPLSMCSSAQAMRRNGTATPKTAHSAIFGQRERCRGRGGEGAEQQAPLHHLQGRRLIHDHLDEQE